LFVGHVVLADGMPWQVKIDDKERSDYGQVFYTLPKRELQDKKIAKLLLKYGTDFKAMRLDLKLNPEGLDKGQLRRMATKMLTRRCKMPTKWLEPKVCFCPFRFIFSVTRRT